MKKLILILILLLITNYAFAVKITQYDKTQSERVVSKFLNLTFSIKSKHDLVAKEKIAKELLKYSKQNDLKYVKQKIDHLWNLHNREKQNAKNDLYNPKTAFNLSFKTKFKKHDNWRKKNLVWFTIFDYQSLDKQSNCESIYLTKVNGDWKL